MPLKTRNASGEMVPLGSMINVSHSFGPDVVQRYNAYTAADINGGPAPGYSSGQAQAAMAKILDETLPRGMSYEWTELAYQQLISGNTGFLVFPLCVLFVFLVLAAQYESLSLPLAIVLIVPMCLLPAITGVLLEPRRQQHLYADRAPGARRSCLQERDPDRGVCQASAGGPWL